METTAVDPSKTEFGKYHLLRKLAQGGMAEIFLANQRGIKGFEKLVVLKRVLPDLSAADDFVQMFLDEARIAARLEHPNIVRIYDLGEVNGQYYIAMEYIAGEDQASVIQQARRLKLQIPLEYAADVIIGAAEALHFAHETEDAQGNPLHLVHRDVSPSNIIFTWQGAAKLVDFGIARAESNISKTAGGQVKGKIQYLSPEQCRSERADSRSDLFALGIVLYELITSKRLFQRDNPLQTMSAILQGEVPQLSSIRPGVPPELESVMRRALMTDPEMRYQTGAELAADLSVWLAGTGWIRGVKSVEFLTRLFGEDRKRAKLKVARGQFLDEAGYAAMVSTAQAPVRSPSGEYDARPASSTSATRPPTSPSGMHPRPPSQPSGVLRTPAPPSINPVDAPRRPSSPGLPLVGTPRPFSPGTPAPGTPHPSRPGVPAVPAARPSRPGPAAAAVSQPIKVDLNEPDEDDSELMRTLAGSDALIESLRQSVDARGDAAPAPAYALPPVPVVAPAPPSKRLSSPSLTAVPEPPRRPSYPQMPVLSAPQPPGLTPAEPPRRPSYSALPTVGAAPAEPPRRPSYSQLPAVGAGLGAPAQPSAFDMLQGGGLAGPEPAAPADLYAERAALFGEVPNKGSAAPASAGLGEAPGPALTPFGAPIDAPSSAPEPAPIPRPRPSRDLTEAAAEAAARIRASSSSPNLQPVSEARPLAPARRSSLGPLLLVALLAAAAGGGAWWYFVGQEQLAPTPQPAPPVVVPQPNPEAPPQKPALEVGGVRFLGLPPGAKVTVDGAAVSNPAGDNFFTKGMHNVVVEAKGMPRFERTIELKVGEVLEVVVGKPKKPAPKK